MDTDIEREIPWINEPEPDAWKIISEVLRCDRIDGVDYKTSASHVLDGLRRAGMIIREVAGETSDKDQKSTSFSKSAIPE